MLYLKPPFHLINGVSIFCDHSDPLQYYFLPAFPKLTRLQDPITKQRIPQIQLIKYRGKAGNGGFLNFDVNLGVEPDILDDIKSEIKRLERLPQLPRLAPVPIVDGTVKMMLFGRESGVTPDVAKFVLKLNHSAKPALYGDNQAAFSVELDQEGVTIMEKALQGEMSPVGIVYSLDYLALRPAYSVSLKVDWGRVQTHLSESFSADIFFSSTEIDRAIDKLVDDRTIVLEADTFVPEGEDTTGVISRRDQALNDVREMITQAFFEPSLEPVKEPQPDGWDKAASFVERLSLIHGTGGVGGAVKFKYRKVDYTRIDRKILNVSFNERTTVKRTIYPQGHLGGICRLLKQEGLDLSGFVISVDTDDAWFDRRKVQVISRANFEEDNISSISVNLKYGQQTKSVILEPALTRSSLEWNSLISNGDMQRSVTASYKVNFKGVDSTERPIALSSIPQVIEVENLEIDPRELYSIIPIPILALGFPWKRYPTVEVQTRYRDEANGIRLTDTFLLNEKNPEQLMSLFVRSPEQKRFQYKLIYRSVDHKDLAMPWVETDEERILLRDPRPAKRSLQVVPNFNWSEVKIAFVDVSYEDKANHLSQSESFEFTEEDSDSKTFLVDLANPDLRLVSYQSTILYHDGSQSAISRSLTRDRRVIIRPDMKGHRIISLRPATLDFVKKKVKEMTVEIRYEDAESHLSYADQFIFPSSSALTYFEFDYVDDKKSSYEYRVTQRMMNGLTRNTKWQKTTVDELILPVGS